MPKTRWARLCKDVNCGLRRGAWYRATSFTPSEVEVRVNGGHRTVPLRHMEITSNRPTRWTLVANGGNGGNGGNGRALSAFWTRGYAVCPHCSHRQLLAGYPRAMRCDECDQRFTVDWDDP